MIEVGLSLVKVVSARQNESSFRSKEVKRNSFGSKDDSVKENVRRGCEEEDVKTKRNS